LLNKLACKFADEIPWHCGRIGDYTVDDIYNTVRIKQYLTFQTLNNISAEKNSTIIFPLPIDLLKHLCRD
jgi:hypothetical protein